MGLKTSIGKGTRARYSTGLEWEKLEKTKKKQTRIIHSTGEGSKIRHSTGTEMDFRALYGEPEGDEIETNQETRLHSIPAKAGGRHQIPGPSYQEQEKGGNSPLQGS